MITCYLQRRNLLMIFNIWVMQHNLQFITTKNVHKNNMNHCHLLRIKTFENKEI